MIRKTFVRRAFSEIHIVGVGGTGGYLAQGLAKMIAGYKLNIDVTLIDPDYIEEKNCARQNFWHYEIGIAKAEALSMRLNQQYGTNFGFIVGKGEEVLNHHHYAGMIVSCVDSLAARKKLKGKGCWLDLGNGETTGQAIFGNCLDQKQLDWERLNWDVGPTVDYLPCPFTAVNMDILKEEPDVPSCADHPFEEQGVFANEWAAQAGLTILHQLLIKQQLKTPHIFFNTANARMNPVFITKELYHV